MGGFGDLTPGEVSSLMDANKLCQKIDAELQPLLDYVSRLIYAVPPAAWTRTDAFSFEHTTQHGTHMRLWRDKPVGKAKSICHASMGGIDRDLPPRVCELLWLRVTFFPERVLMERREADREKAVELEEWQRYKQELWQNLKAAKAD
ncbi:MAG: hypothetical protein ACAH95_01970 [Fimbriimonas sp.]